MAKKVINVGSAYDSLDDEAARDAFVKCNDNFTELYDANDTQANENEYLQGQIDDLGTLIGTKSYQDVPIGGWNMDANNSKSVAWTLPANKSIRTIYVIIYQDTNTNVAYPLNYNPNGNVCEGAVFYDGTYFQLVRLAGGTFDSSTYDSTSVNRGIITVEYDSNNPT
jgi:hypothetical protein